MNNLSSYCGLVDARIRASDKDLPVTCVLLRREHMYEQFEIPYLLTVLLSIPLNKTLIQTVLITQNLKIIMKMGLMKKVNIMLKMKKII